MNFQHIELADLFPGEEIPPGYLVHNFANIPSLYLIQTYPVSLETQPRTPGRYAPLRGNVEGTAAETLDSVVIAPWGGEKGSKLGHTLQEWIDGGFSANWIVGGQETPIMVRWVDPNISSAQMAGDCWNKRAMAIIAHTTPCQELSGHQIDALGTLIAYANACYQTKIAYLGDLSEARPFNPGNRIENIATVREVLKLHLLPKAL